MGQVALIGMLVAGLVGFILIGYVLVHLAEGRRFRDQSAPRKRAIVCLALAQWPYLLVAGIGVMGLLGLM